MGKELFWGKHPYYPEINTIYRKLFQKFEIDNSKRIKLYDAICGTDICNIASGSGPYVEYYCDETNAKLVELNIKKLGLADKIERSSPQNSEVGIQVYFAHIFSFFPNLDEKNDIDWQGLDESTSPGGYIFLPKLVTRPKNQKKKISRLLASSIPFYFYYELDHTNHWISILEKKIEILKNETPSGLSGANKAIIDAFRTEVSKWVIEVKKLKSKEHKILTIIYKHNDEG